MKMVKSLLLVSAAGLVAASGAQAADLPVKAKPVEYVKVCSLYGAGFYYIPGTDICMKIGGYVRYQVSSGIGNSISFGPFNTTGGFNTRSDNGDYAQRVRVTVSQDTRQQTAYGTLRTYLILGWTHDTPTATTSPAAPSVYFTRGFIQIAGFTFGKSTSFFDFASTAAVAYNAGFLSTSDTGDPGQIGAAYTAQFGNGMSATISVEQSRRAPTVYVGGYAVTGLSQDNLGGGAAGVATRPDIVGNWRIDQAWGSVQLMAAAHDASASYYGGQNGFGALGVYSGHPDDKWGWAAGVGARFNTPMIGPGDYFQIQGTYSEGAIKFASNSACAGNSNCNYWSGNSFGFGFGDDANFAGTLAAPGTINLTTAWSVFASYEHFWTPALRTSIYGSYLDVSRSAAGNAVVCASILTGAQLAAGMQCDGDYQYWAIGSRSQWNVTKDFYVGLDVIYGKLQSASVNNGAAFVPGANLLATGRPAPAGVTYSTADQDQVSVTWRVHRDIVP